MLSKHQVWVQWHTRQTIVVWFFYQFITICDAKVRCLAKGYTSKLADDVLEYPLADRAPSEGYLVDNYSSYALLSTHCPLLIKFHRTVHTDPTFCDFTLSWNTSYDTSNCDTTKKIFTTGGNFVDVSLKVVVLNDVGTALVWSYKVLNICKLTFIICK